MKDIRLTDLERSILETVLNDAAKPSVHTPPLVQFVFNTVVDPLRDKLSDSYKPEAGEVVEVARLVAPKAKALSESGKPTSRKPHVWKRKPEYMPVIALLADGCSTQEVSEKTNFNAIQIGLIKSRFKDYIEKLSHLPVGEPRMKFLRKNFTWAGGETYDPSFAARVRGDVASLL